MIKEQELLSLHKRNGHPSSHLNLVSNKDGPIFLYDNVHRNANYQLSNIQHLMVLIALLRGAAAASISCCNHGYQSVLEIILLTCTVHTNHCITAFDVIVFCVNIGVPDKTDNFLNFLQQVRKERKDLDEPVVVHCR